MRDDISGPDMRMSLLVHTASTSGRSRAVAQITLALFTSACAIRRILDGDRTGININIKVEMDLIEA